jgi:iron-sulfur cluster repair protein YtfE (RIC family)
MRALKTSLQVTGNGGAKMNPIHELPGTHSGENLIKLVDTIPFLHHQVLRQKLASLYRVIQRIAANHVVPITVMDRFERQFLSMADHLESNLEEQECWLFAWLRRLVKRLPATGRDNYLGESLQEAMEQATAANQKILEDLGQIQMCLGIPEWADKGLLAEELIDRLRDLEEEMIEYERLEREELFPRVREFCQSYTREEVINAY